VAIRLPKIPPGPWELEYPFASHYLELGPDKVMHYLDEGEGPPVVMVHGNPSWSFMFRRLVKGLEGYRRLAPDHLGMGLSTRPRDGYGFRLADRVDDFSAWIESLGLGEPVHLVLHDWGGPIALGWAGAHPDRVASVTAMNTGLRRPENFKIPARLGLFRKAPALRNLLAVHLNLFAAGVVRHCSVRPFSPAAADGFLAPYRSPAHREALARFVADIPLGEGHPTRAFLAGIDRDFASLAGKPFLLPWGMRDFVFSPLFYDDLRARLPGARLLPLFRSGHCLLEDEPEAVGEAVRTFLDEHSGRAAGG
jgi:haloalkane dehalogenase